MQPSPPAQSFHPPPPLLKEGNTYKTDILVLNGGMSKNTSPSSINVVTCFVLRPWCNRKTNLFQFFVVFVMLLFSLLFAISCLSQNHGHFPFSHYKAVV